jgi:hypothetical protein
MDHGFLRDKQPWEFSEGIVFLLRELATVDYSLVSPYTELFCDLARLDGPFDHLRETIWKAFPGFAKNIGARNFKNDWLELLIPYMFRDMRHSNRSVVFAATDCID